MTEKKSRPGEKAANPNENSSHATTYPRRIHLSDTAEACIAGLAVDLMLAEVELHQLPPSVVELWEYGYQTGRQSRQAEIDYANRAADRLYREVCRRPAARAPDLTSFADVQRRRGFARDADRIDAANVRRFARATS